MLSDMADGMSGMMLGMGFVWLLIVFVLLLCVAALIKYLFSNSGRRADDD